MYQPPLRAASAVVSARYRLFVGLLAVLPGLAWPAAAQLRPLVLQNATVLTGDGKTIEGASIMINSGRITAVGPRVDAPFLARKVDARGKFVTPGLIDLHTTFGLVLDGGTGGGLATAAAADAFNRFAEDDIRAALRQGVTTVYVPARPPTGVGGVGAVVRLIPGGEPNDVVLKREAALHVTIDASNSQGPLQRVKALTELRKLMRGAKEYRENWEDYLEELKEYEEKLAKEAKDQPSEGDKTATNPAGDRKPGRASRVADGGKAAPPPGTPDEKKREDAKGEKKDDKKDEIKKPAQPPNDRNAATILRVFDGELVLRGEANTPSDIAAVLDLAIEYGAALILEGGAGAHLLADRIAAARVPVVLSAPPETVAYAAGPTEFRRADAAAVLARAGVDVYFGTGVVSAGETPRLALLAARAVGHGLDSDKALAAITSKAADLLGLEELGRIAPGKQADLVVWSDHPFAPGARVERVLVSGREVFVADGAEGE